MAVLQLKSERRQRLIHLLVRRMVILVPVALGVCVLSFLLLHLVPGDPARLFLGEKATESAVQSLRHKWGLDEPLITQFGTFFIQLLHGNLGYSQTLHLDVGAAIAGALPVTLSLMVLGTIFGVLLSFPAAYFSARHPNGFIDQLCRGVLALVQGIPQFLLGTLLILWLGLQLHLFPVGGYGDTFSEQISSLILPSLTVGIGMMPVLVRGFRQALLDVRDSDVVTFGIAKGLPSRRVVGTYLIRPASSPMISLLGIQLGSLVGGVMVVENVFAIPGMGKLLMAAIMTRDFPVVRGATLVSAALVVIVFAITDVIYAISDPRVRVEG